MRKIYTIGLAAVAAAALTITGGSAATAGENSSTDTVMIPTWVTNGPNFQDDFTGCSSHHANRTASSETGILP